MTPWWKGRRGEYYVLVQFLLFALVILGPTTWGGFGRWPAAWRPVTTVLGLLLGGTGGLLALAGLISLGRNLTAVPHPKDDASLVESGAYALVRHPIYSGIIFGAAGWAVLRASTPTLFYALLLFLFFDLKSRREEQWLKARYPDYARYQERVRKLLPFLY